MHYWLVKTEPGDYSIADLNHDGMTPWSGVRNYQARNFMREMQIGDQVLIYHSNNGKNTGIVGVGEVASTPYADPTQFDKKSKYFDPKSTKIAPRWQLVDISFKQQFATPLLLSTMRTIPALASMRLLQKGSRLSVVPVQKTEFTKIIKRR